MKKILNRAVLFLTLITLFLSLNSGVYAAGDVTPTPTNSPTPTPEEIVEEETEETKGGITESNGSAEYGTPVYGGEPVYGGGVSSPKEGEFLADKLVKNPSTGVFVDQLGPIDPKYRPLDIVEFIIKVSNPGSQTNETIEIVDYLPEFVDFMSGPGEYDQESRQLKFTVEDLAPDETREFEIKARISHQSSLPEDNSVVCPVNVIDAAMADRQDHDESQFCIEKEMEVPQVPEAGAEQLVLALLGVTLSAGLNLRKRSIKSN